jgi:hypothetical protein
MEGMPKKEKENIRLCFKNKVKSTYGNMLKNNQVEV